MTGETNKVGFWKPGHKKLLMKVSAWDCDNAIGQWHKFGNGLYWQVTTAFVRRGQVMVSLATKSSVGGSTRIDQIDVVVDELKPTLLGFADVLASYELFRRRDWNLYYVRGDGKRPAAVRLETETTRVLLWSGDPAEAMHEAFAVLGIGEQSVEIAGHQ